MPIDSTLIMPIDAGCNAVFRRPNVGFSSEEKS